MISTSVPPQSGGFSKLSPKRLWPLVGRSWVVGLLLFSLVISCSQKSPVAPEVPPPPVQPNLAISASSLSLVGKLIGWLGGQLLIPIENTSDTSLLVIPKGSLLTLVNITASARLDQDARATIYEFGPDGLKFLRPALLLHRAREPNGKVLTLWYFNPKTQQWEKSGSAVVIAGVATFPVLHFSKWKVTGGYDALSSGGQQ